MKFTPFFILKHEENDNRGHLYLKYSDKIVEGRIPYVALALTKKYIQSKKQSDADWKTDKKLYLIHWEKEGHKIDSEPINYRIILNNIKKYKEFNPNSLKLPVLSEAFLDIPSSSGLVSHPLTDKNTSQMNLISWNHSDFLGENFPITSRLNREGIIIGSFLDDFIRRIIARRSALVSSSDKFFTLEWFFNFRDVINDSIASLEIALNLIYNKAQFDAHPDWIFDVNKLGAKYGRRFKDKLGWIYQISGKSFDIEKEKNSLLMLQELRNHLNHFDPPSFCVTIEECANILNMVVDIGMVHLKMRKCLGLSFSISLINLVLQPMVVFKPESRYDNRAVFDGNIEGYNTCRWPKSID